LVCFDHGFPKPAQVEIAPATSSLNHDPMIRRVVFAMGPTCRGNAEPDAWVRRERGKAQRRVNHLADACLLDEPDRDGGQRVRGNRPLV
jgi:hypothetical protein